MSGPFGATPWMYDERAFYPLTIDQSLKFNDDESQYLSWTPATAGNLTTWTWSGWAKRANVASGSYYLLGVSVGTSQWFFLGFTNAGTLDVRQFNSSGYDFRKISTAIYRDPSSWYHIVMSYESGNATAEDRIKLYVNGERVISFSTNSNPSSGLNAYVSQTNKHVIGAFSDNNGSSIYSFFDGYLSDVYFIDGQALDSTNFGEFKEGIWIPKVYNGTYGSNGFHLPFKNDNTVEGFNAVTYRGTGTSQSVSGLGLAADLVWIKDRTDGTENHWLYDSVRGATIGLSSNLTDGEYTLSNALTSFENDGFTVGIDGKSNRSGDQYVAWCWDAGSGSPVSNTDGSITSTVKANPSYGFSIVSYTGTGNADTVGHGLSDTPTLIITKQRSSSNPWPVNSGTLFASGNMMFLDRTDAEVFGGSNALASYSNTTFGVSAQGATGAINDSGETYIAYCFAEVAGYSSIGSYTGTGATGNVVTTGFRPAFLLYKRTDAGGNDWVIMDTTRSPANPVENRLFPNLSNAESAGAGGGIDVTDTGFVINNTYANANASGGNYIYMAFADTREAAFWKDVSGNDNNWTPVNLDYRDSLPDSTTNNFATFNPLVRRRDVTTLPTFSEGNLKVVYPNAGGNVTYAAGTIPITSGKWYYESRINSLSTNNVVVGWATEDEIAGSSSHVMIYSATGAIYIDGSLQSTEGALSVGDIIGTTIDLDNGYVGFYKNGVALSTSPSISVTSASWWNSGGLQEFLFAWNRGSTSDGTSANFGQDSTFAGLRPAGGNQDDNGIGDFAYAPPSGYLALCTANLPTSTIIDGSEHFTTMLHTGTGSQQAVTGAGFAPDFRWTKSRGSAYSHILHDNVRGETAYLQSNNTNAENTLANMSLDSDGFTVHADDLGDPQVSWLWKAGGTAVSNTDGSITSQVSANTDAGFSVVSWVGNGTSGATIGHSLGVTPDVVIVKNRTTSGTNWPVFHSSQGTGSNGYLDITNSWASGSTWGSTQTFNSTVFSVGSQNYVNNSGDNMIAYCFHSVDGFSKVGSYTGNGSSDGTFVYTGFRPAWVMVKRTDGIGNWIVMDSERDTYNVTDALLSANESAAESVDDKFDFLSNGFKNRDTGSWNNASGGSYIYIAFAETPQKFANAR